MTSLTDSLGRIIHETASSLLEKQVSSKISAAITTVVESGFGVVDDALKVVRDVTAPEEDKPPPQDDGAGGEDAGTKP